MAMLRTEIKLRVQTVFNHAMQLLETKTARASEKKIWYDFYRDLPSNETTTNVVLCDIDLHFEGQTFQVVILTSLGKCQYYYCHELGSHICHEMAPLPMLHIMTVTQIFKVTNFVMRIYRKR